MADNKDLGKLYLLWDDNGEPLEAFRYSFPDQAASQRWTQHVEGLKAESRALPQGFPAGSSTLDEGWRTWLDHCDAFLRQYTAGMVPVDVRFAINNTRNGFDLDPIPFGPIEAIRVPMDVIRALGDQCAVVLSLPLYTMLLNRINDVENESERRRQLKELQEVLRVLVLPNQCLHITMEETYGDPDVPFMRYPCDDDCPYCCGDHLQLTGKVKRAELVDALGAILNDGTPLLKTLGEGLLEDHVKSKVFTTAMSNVEAGHVHALILQPIVADIIHVNDAGGTKWSTWVKNGSQRLAHCDDERWQGINYE